MLRTEPAEPLALPLSKRAELLEFAKAVEAGTVQLEYVRCEACGCSYPTGWGCYSECPRCVVQEPCLSALLEQRECWPGHDFVWHEERGPHGCWVPRSDYVPVSRDALRAIWEAVKDAPGVGAHMMLDAAVTKAIGDLRQLIAEADFPNRERAEREAKRASQLADECGRLRAALERKRIECDELRDGRRHG